MKPNPFSLLLLLLFSACIILVHSSPFNDKHECQSSTSIPSPPLPCKEFTSCEEFYSHFWNKQPGVIRNSHLHLPPSFYFFQNETTTSSLLHNPMPIQLSTSVSYTGRVTQQTTVAQHVHSILSSTTSQLGNETFYLFGNHQGKEWEAFLSKYPRLELNPLFTCMDKLNLSNGALSFGCANNGTGVPWHFHGPGFLQVLLGIKQWFLVPLEVKDEDLHFDPNVTTIEWFVQQRNNLPSSLLSCELLPGDVIYFPPMWKHATANTGEWNSWMSTFL